MRGRIYTMEELLATEGQEREWAYNALDCTGTRKVYDVLAPRLNANQARTYAFHKSLQAPCLAMMRRGVLVDQQRLHLSLTTLKKELETLKKVVAKMPEVLSVWDKTELVTGLCIAPPLGKHHKWPKGVPDSPERKCERCGTSRVVHTSFNPNSHDQCAHLFHVLWKWPRVKNKKGEYSTDDEVLEKLEREYSTHAHVIAKIRDGRDLAKQIGFLKSRQTPGGRMPSSFSVAAAWTSRFSSHKNPLGLGTNVQNVSERHRWVFVADPGYEMFYADLERAESLVVAYVSGDEGYIKAHDGDTHTLVASLLWPGLPWTGDPAQDKKIAEALPEWDQTPGHNFRFQAKRIQHGSNFGLTPRGIAMIAHIPLREATLAQGHYFEAFPGIRRWQNGITVMVTEQQPIINPLGFEVSLFGRPWDGHTVRQAFSLVPQSTVAHVLNIGLRRVWRDLDPHTAQVMAQVHDAILGQWPHNRRMEAAMAIRERMLMPIVVHSPTGTRTMRISVEIMAGQNWGKFNDKPEKGPLNPNGMKVLHV